MVSIVLLPGLDGTASLFAEFASALGPDFEVISVAYPADAALGYAELERLTREALPKGRPFILLGESFSGPIAISIAASAPAGLIGLVLCCSFARNPIPALGAARSLVRWLPVKAVPQRLLRFFLLGRFSTPSLAAQLRQALVRVSSHALKARAMAVLSIDVSHKLRTVPVPVLYLRASEDRAVSPASSSLIESLAPSVTVVELVAPHFLLQTAAKQAAIVVSDFSTRLAFSQPLRGSPAAPPARSSTPTNSPIT